MNLLNDLLSKYNDIKININIDTSVSIEIELTSRSSLRDIRVTIHCNIVINFNQNFQQSLTATGKVWGVW
jgi:hypothetical protein